MEEEEVCEATLAKFILVENKPAASSVKISKCCSAKRDEPIRGFYTKDKKLTIHKSNCPNIYALDQTGEVSVSWAKEETAGQKTMIIVLHDRVGILADIMGVIASQKVNIISIHTKNKKSNILVKIRIPCLKEIQLTMLKTALKKVKNVLDVKVS
jgi:GTP pyrophosphokinase